MQRFKQLRATLVLATSLFMLAIGVVAARAAAVDLPGVVSGRTEPGASSTPTATEPGGGEPTCTAEECSCGTAAREPSATPTLAELAWRRPHARAREEAIGIKVKFNIKTDAKESVSNFDPTKDVSIEVKQGDKLLDPADFRSYIAREKAADDPVDCYRMHFDSRRMERCDEFGEVKVFVNNLPKEVRALVQDPAVITEPDGFKFTRYFYSFGKRRANAEFTIEVLCLMK
jgi:hypothetical protein